MVNKTPNYQLEQPTADEFYDVEVQNGNMQKIDTELKRLDDEKANSTDLSNLQTQFNEHKEQNADIKHKANEVSVVAPVGIVASTTQEYLDALFTGYSSKLTDMVDALLLINPSLPLDSNSTMQDILDVLASGDIGDGKKVVNGTANVSNVKLPFMVAGASTPTEVYYVEVNDFDFTPSIIYIYETNAGVTNTNRYHIDERYNGVSISTYGNTRYLVNTQSSLITDGRFLLPHNPNASTMNTLVHWTVVE